MILHFFNTNWYWFCWLVFIFGIGFLVDQQFNQCKVTNRTKWYQPISTTWHILIELAMAYLAFMHLQANPTQFWWLPVLAFLWTLSTMPMGILQHRKNKERPWYGIGDGKGNLVEITMKAITWVVNLLLKRKKLSMAAVSVGVRLAIQIIAIVLYYSHPQGYF